MLTNKDKGAFIRPGAIIKRGALAAFGLVFLAAVSATTPGTTMVAYLGGAGTDDCDGITLDRAGDIYLACHSDSPDFPHLPAKAAPGSRDDMDAVILKIEARTDRIVWATRAGGSKWDAAGDLEVGKDGPVYVLGQTESADLPTTADAVQPQFGGPRRDAVVLKLDAGGKIVYSTFWAARKTTSPRPWPSRTTERFMSAA